MKGALHRVVVQQGCIRLLDKSHPRFDLPTAVVFCKVVADDEVLRMVAQAANQDERTVA